MRKALIVILLLASAILQAATVEIAAPPSGAAISGSQVEIKVAFDSTAEKPITKIQVYLDGAFASELALESAELKGTRSFTWDTLRTPNGPHKVDIQAFSKDEYLTMASLSVTIENKAPDFNPPKVAITSPKEGEFVSGTISVVIEASDDGPTEPFVSIFIDGSLRSVKNHAPYSYEWDTRAGEDRSYVIRAIAVDEAGNRAEAKSVHVTVRNPKRQVPITERDFGR